MELLVVIGIIAVLIGILLPSLNKAREQSYRTKCLANLRSIGQALSIYAAENNDCVPLGTVSSNPTDANLQEMWFTYFAYWKGPSVEKPTALGRLATIRVLKTSPMAFYCPKEDRVGLSYDTMEGANEANPWAFKSDPPKPSRHTYIGYWVRPVAVFSGTDTDDRPYMIEGRYSSNTVKFLPGWPKLSKLKSKAIVADIARGPVDVKLRHKDGVNVYYANGSGKYVRLSDFDKAQGVGKASVTFPIPIPGTPGPKWVDQEWTNSPYLGQGLPKAGDTTYGHNTLYLNDTPIFPGAAGFWNWLDRAP